LDSHMGTLQLRPEFFDVYLNLAMEFELPLRLSGIDTQELVGFPFRELAAQEGILTVDTLVFYSGVSARGPFEELLLDVPLGVTEMYMHPAADHAELRACAPDAAGRIDDLELLTEEPAMRDKIEAAGVVLIGWREIRELQRSGATPQTV
ncbi:MAG: ChbG/HpnK family deacetylase, partial [Microthrixaceae bacterium]